MRPIWSDEEVRLDEALRRYFRVSRLITALESKRLYFPAAHQSKTLSKVRSRCSPTMSPHKTRSEPRARANLAGWS